MTSAQVTPGLGPARPTALTPKGPAPPAPLYRRGLPGHLHPPTQSCRTFCGRTEPQCTFNVEPGPSFLWPEGAVPAPVGSMIFGLRVWQAQSWISDSVSGPTPTPGALQRRELWASPCRQRLTCSGGGVGGRLLKGAGEACAWTLQETVTCAGNGPQAQLRLPRLAYSLQSLPSAALGGRFSQRAGWPSPRTGPPSIPLRASHKLLSSSRGCWQRPGPTVEPFPCESRWSHGSSRALQPGVGSRLFRSGASLNDAGSAQAAPLPSGGKSPLGQANGGDTVLLANNWLTLRM